MASTASGAAPASSAREKRLLRVQPFDHRLDHQIGLAPCPRGPARPAAVQAARPAPSAVSLPAATRASKRRVPVRAIALSRARGAGHRSPAPVPACAKTCAMPRPIVPSPTTPITGVAAHPATGLLHVMPRSLRAAAPKFQVRNFKLEIVLARMAGLARAQASGGAVHEDSLPRRRPGRPLLRHLDEAARPVARGRRCSSATAPNDTFGWGVVLSDDALATDARRTIPSAPTAIRAHFAYWDDIAVVHDGRAHRLGRARLLPASAASRC